MTLKFTCEMLKRIESNSIYITRDETYDFKHLVDNGLAKKHKLELYLIEITVSGKDFLNKHRSKFNL